MARELRVDRILVRAGPHLTTGSRYPGSSGGCKIFEPGDVLGEQCARSFPPSIGAHAAVELSLNRRSPCRTPCFTFYIDRL